MTNAIQIIEQIKKLATPYDLSKNDELIFRLGQIRGICDQVLADRDPRVLVPSPEKAASLHEKLIKQVQNSNSIGLLSEAEQNDVKTFAEVCKDIIPEEPCTDEDTKVIKLLERRGEHMNLKFEINHRWLNNKYAKTVYSLLSKSGICTMSDLMQLLDDPDIRDLIYYRDSRKKDDLKKIADRFPIFELNSDDCHKIVEIYDTANDKSIENGKPKDAKTVLSDFLRVPTLRHINALGKFGITNINELYFWLSKHTLKEYKKIRGIADIPDSVMWLHGYINRKVTK